MINSIVSETDLNGFITFASESFCRSSGFTKNELIGAPHSIVRHPDNPKEFFSKLWVDLKNGKTWKGLMKNKNKFGGTYEVNVTIGPKYNKKNELVGYYALRHQVYDDVIRSKQNKLDEAFIKFTKIIDNLTVALLIVDKKDKIVDFNSYFLKMFDVKVKKVYSLSFKDFFDDELEYMKFDRFKDIPTKLRTKNLITKFVKPDGSKFLVEIAYFHMNENDVLINIKDLSPYINLSESIEELK